MTTTEEQSKQWRPKLRSFLLGIPMSERDDFAGRCGTTSKQLMQVAYGRYCNVETAVKIHSESNGLIPLEEVYPSLDWNWVRDLLTSRHLGRSFKAGKTKRNTVTH